MTLNRRDFIGVSAVTALVPMTLQAQDARTLQDLAYSPPPPPVTPLERVPEPSELTERQRVLLTLLVDHINYSGESMGAGNDNNWRNNPTYSMQGVLDRIGKVIYARSMHPDPTSRSMFPPDLGDEFYDHQIRCEWRELFGPGREGNKWDTDPKLQDSAGKWHSPCDTGMWVTLYHPSKQPTHEIVCGYWNGRKKIHWRPMYEFSDVEVVEALQIMSHEFNWKFERDSDSRSMFMFGDDSEYDAKGNKVE